MAHEMRIVHMQSLAGHRLARDKCTCRQRHTPPGRPGPLDALCAGVKNVANHLRQGYGGQDVEMVPNANTQSLMKGEQL